MGVGKDDAGRVCAEDDVAELDATWGDDVAKGEVVFAEELGEVMKEDEEEAESAPVQITAGGLEVCGFEERPKELEQRK